MDDRIELVIQKYNNAGRHTEALRSAVNSFLQDEPYKLGFRVDPDGRPAYFVAAVKATPPAITCALGDVLHNLRCTLDHLAYQMVLASDRHESRRLDQVSFPICESQDKYEKRKRSGDPFLSCLAPAAMNAVDQLKPYRGGNDRLWWLNQLNNIDKHRMILTAAGSGDAVDLGASHDMQEMLESDRTLPDHVRKGMASAIEEFGKQPLFFRSAEQIFPLRVGDVFFRGAIGGRFNPKVKLLVNLSVGESAILPPTPIYQLIDGISDAVMTALKTLRQYVL